MVVELWQNEPAPVNTRVIDIDQRVTDDAQVCVVVVIDTRQCLSLAVENGKEAMSSCLIRIIYEWDTVGNAVSL